MVPNDSAKHLLSASDKQLVNRGQPLADRSSRLSRNDLLGGSGTGTGDAGSSLSPNAGLGSETAVVPDATDVQTRNAEARRLNRRAKLRRLLQDDRPPYVLEVSSNYYMYLFVPC